ncbi:MAG: DNA polymerase III subunit delta [Isosphaeraceae bacterium]
MNAIEFLKEPSKQPVYPIYAVYGDDRFLQREVLRELREALLPGEDDDLSIARFPGSDTPLADVLDELRTLPFFAKRRIVVVDDADPFVSAHRKELEGYAENPAEKGNLVLMVKSWPGNTRLAKLVDKVGLAIDCKGPSDRQILPWLVHVAKNRYKVALEATAAELLLELIGPEAGLLITEVEKLAVYVGTRAKVNRDDVSRMVGGGRIETVWKALEAATTGRADLALEHLDSLITAGEPPARLLSAMGVSLLKVYHAGYLRRQRMELKEACATAGIPQWPAAIEQVRLQHAHLGPDRVDRLPAMLLRADLDMKGSSMLAPRAVLERLIVELASPRRD